MARATCKLTNAHLKSKRPGLHADGGGLFLQVTLAEDGTPRRSWLCRVRLPGGTVRTLGLGRAAEVTLQEARALCAQYRGLARQGIDPRAHEKAERAAEAAQRARAMTFREAAEAYIEAHAPSWKNSKHAAQWPASLEAYAYPVLEGVAVADVDRAMVLNVIRPLWGKRTETASRLRGRIEAVLDWAAVQGLRQGDNPARWRGALDKVLPARAKVQRQQHHAAMPYLDAPGFMAKLAESGSAGADCLRFVILTAARSGEARGARWDEIDMAAATWTVPAERMKAGRAHRVALSAAAMDLLHARANAQGSAPGDLVFSSDVRPGSPLSDMTLTAILRRGGLPATVHGFRSTFRDWAAERTHFPREVCEAALAHVNSDRVEAAYRRSDLFEHRRRLMQSWADFLAAPQAAEGASVTRFPAERLEPGARATLQTERAGA